MSLRVPLRVAAITLLLLLCVPLFGIARLFGKSDFWVAFFLRHLGRVLGLRLAIAGQPVATDVLYVANHLSWLDILALGGARYTRFVAKSEIAGWPLIGWLARLGGSVFVHRGRRSATREQADAVAMALRDGWPVALFAEGGTNNGVALSPFRPALFAAAVQAGAKVQPVAIDYGARAAEVAWPDGARFAAEMKRMLRRTGAVPVTLRYLPPLDAGEHNRKVLAARSEAAVADALGMAILA